MKEVVLGQHQEREQPEDVDDVHLSHVSSGEPDDEIEGAYKRVVRKAAAIKSVVQAMASVGANAEERAAAVRAATAKQGARGGGSVLKIVRK